MKIGRSMRKIGFFNIGRLGLVRTWQVETNINEIIEKWIPKHMVFWYDMAKPVDVYIPGVTYANQFINDGGKLSYDSTINKCTITHTPTSANKNFWQTPCSPSSAVSSFKIRVTGLPQGFSIESGIYSTKITSDGEYDIPEYKNSGTTTRYPGFYLAGDNVNDVDCNIVVEEIPTRQSVPTNEILKSNPYLQDFSGNNRPLKLNNFLFAAMSGVGGYETNFSNTSIWINSPQHGTIINDHTYNPIPKGSSSGLYTTSSVKVKFKAIVTGMKSGYRLEFGSGDVAPSDKSIYEDGEYEFSSGDADVLYGFKLYSDDYSNPNTDVIIELKEVYPNALVTDGVDDYGQVQNLSQGVKMLFYTCNNFRLGQQLYDQRKVGYNNVTSSYFSIFAESNSIAYNARNVDGSTYIDGVLNETIIADNLLEKKTTITIVNGSADSEKTGTPSFFSLYNHLGYFGTLAFYNSIGFDAVPAKETDGFTEQDLIDYYIPKSIVTITVVDVNGAPIENATVTIEGLQYNTLSDGTVKVVGIANSTMSISVTKDGYMPYSNNEWKFANSRIILEVINNIIIMEDGNNILLENNNLILTED